MTKLTIHEIANMAGVSIGTVSRVLNNRAGVHESTRTSVLEIVRRVGYVPDAGARKLARGERGLIGIAPFSTHAASSPYFSILLDSIQEVLVAQGYAGRVLEPEHTDLDKVNGFIVPGIFIDDSRLTLLRERGVVTSVIGRAEGEVWVSVDNTGGMTRVMQHLVKLGHRRIVHLTGSPIGQETFDRLEAYHNALSDAALPELPELVLDGKFTELGGYRAIRAALEQGLTFSAVAAASDEMALGAILALQDAGLRVPYDVSVTGFDGLPYFDFLEPKLTTVRQPIRELGRAAALRVMAQLEGQTPQKQIPERQTSDRQTSEKQTSEKQNLENLTLPTKLMVRGSSGPAPRSKG